MVVSIKATADCVLLLLRPTAASFALLTLLRVRGFFALTALETSPQLAATVLSPLLIWQIPLNDLVRLTCFDLRCETGAVSVTVDGVDSNSARSFSVVEPAVDVHGKLSSVCDAENGSTVMRTRSNTASSRPLMNSATADSDSSAV
jgi:hypothetical protein